MASSIIQHLHLGGASLSYRKKFRLFFTVVAVVLVLGCVKIGVHYFGFEFLELNALLTSGIGGAIFIIGFLLSSVLADYKEAERIPAAIPIPSRRPKIGVSFATSSKTGGMSL